MDSCPAYQENLRQAEQIGSVNSLLKSIDINILRMIAIGDPSSIAGWKSENAGRFTQVDGLLQQLGAAATNARMRDGLTKLSDAYQKMRP